MTKQTDKNKSALLVRSRISSSDGSNVSISFFEFWSSIAERLGNARLRINIDATSINDFFDASGDPKNYLIKLVKTSYKRSKCHHLRDLVNLNHVLDILGETASELKEKQQDDLYDIEFLEEIALLISEQYSYCFKTTKAKQTNGKIQSLVKYKIRLNNSNL